MAGKPAKPDNANAKDPQARALGNLQYILDRACNFIHDGQSSFAVRARRAAKRGVPKATVTKGLTALESAVSDARAAVERAYTPEAKKEVVQKSRVTL